MRRFFVIIVPLVLLLAACGAPETGIGPTGAPAAATPAAATPSATADTDPCGPAALETYRGEYTGVLDRWGSALLTAGQAHSDSLQASITSLQKLADELNAVQPPACAASAHAETLAAMQMSIGGYQDLMAKKDVGSTLINAIDKLNAARAKVAALPGTPIPLPTQPPSPTPLPTFTPIPTATPTVTPAPTATPEPRQAIIAGRTQMYESPTSNVAIKTLAKDTRVLVFETQKGRIHIRVDNVDGWVSASTVIIQ